MDFDPFEEPLAKLRHRFASTLEGKIEDTCAALPNLAGEGRHVVDAVAATYRQIHGISGMGASVGFTQTGKVAREVEEILLDPYRTHRGLTEDEVASVRNKLQTLREAARAELQSTDACMP
jgi:chemotaxis protein histidine kinase CheA